MDARNTQVLMLNTDMCLAFAIGENGKGVLDTVANSCHAQWPFNAGFTSNDWSVIEKGFDQCEEADVAPRGVAEEYADENCLFINDLSVLTKMLRLGYGDTPCPPCASSVDCCCNGNCVPEKPTEKPTPRAHAN